MSEERTMPHSLDAERSVLGAILLHSEVLIDAAEHVQPQHFFRAAHRTLFEHFLKLSEARIEIDFPTVQDSLVRAKELEAIGGPAYIAALVDGVPRSTNVANYARIVREKSDLRDIISAANQMRNEAYEAHEDARVVIDNAEQRIFEIAQGATSGGFKRLSAILPGVVEQIEAWRQNRGVSGIASGFRDLDEMTRGFQSGTLTIIAARPSMGKTALMLNIAEYVSRGDKTVGVFSLEMSEDELAIRTLTGEAGVDGHRLRGGYIGERDWGRLAHAMGVLGELNLFIDESPYITVFEMRARARRLKAEHGLSLLVVDYTQLMISQEKDRKENRTLELGAISRGLKALAKDLKIPVIALSQLSRQCESRTDKRPVLSDLRESGALEQDADVVIFIYRDEVYHPTTEAKGIAELIIAKQRNGPVGRINLAWIASQTRFADLALENPSDQQLPIGAEP